MEQLRNGLPIIIHESTDLNCFLGVVKGTFDGNVYDQQTNNFPCIVTVNTNLGSGSTSLDLSGNQTIKKSIKGMDVTITISNWSCTDASLSFHIKAEASKFIASCTIIDKTLSGKRYELVAANQKMQEALEKIAKEEERIT